METMGSMIQLICSTCDIDREESVGIGMMGIGNELCACYNCKRYVRKKVKWTDDPAKLKCPYCRKLIRAIRNGHKCPKCSSRIRVKEVGIWD